MRIDTFVSSLIHTYEFTPPFGASIVAAEASRLFPDRPWLWEPSAGGWGTDWVTLAELALEPDMSIADEQWELPPNPQLVSISRSGPG